MRTNIEIDNVLINKARRLSGFKTKKEVVEAGLNLIVQLRQQETAKEMFGKLQWQGDLDDMRTNK